MGKYFKYAIGEIILVVIGILIALQINNWNEHQKLLAKEQDYLKEIKSSLIQDTLSINQVIEFNVGKREIVTGLMGVFADSLSNDERAFLIEKYTNPFTIYQVFNPKKTAWNNLIASENLNVLTNKELRNILMEYYGYDYTTGVQERVVGMNRRVIDNYFASFFTKEQAKK